MILHLTEVGGRTGWYIGVVVTYELLYFLDKYKSLS